MTAKRIWLWLAMIGALLPAVLLTATNAGGTVTRQVTVTVNRETSGLSADREGSVWNSFASVIVTGYLEPLP